MKKTPLKQRNTYVKLLSVGILVCSAFFILSSWNNAKINVNENLVEYKSINFFPDDAYKVPHDVQFAKDSGQVKLSQFAWQEFIALNWPSNYGTVNNEFTRGKPDTSKSVKKFLSPPNTGQLVWQTYKHRVEMYPKDSSKFNPEFNSAPQYFYKLTDKKGNGQKSITGLNSTIPLRNVNTIFNNLDETSELNLCAVFVDGDPDAPGAKNHPNAGIASGLPGAPRRMIYEAKGNRDMFDYIKNNNLYDSITRVKKIANTGVAIKTLGKGAVYLKNPSSETIVFPFGDTKKNGAEGSIEVKATWRQLTLKEYKSGRYLTAPILYYRSKVIKKDTITFYDIVKAKPVYKNSKLVSLPYGLVGLHIIHKTVNFPSYVFATFEQVDNLSKIIEPKNTLFYYNRNSNPSVNPEKQYAYRANAISSKTEQVNADVHNQIKKLSPKSNSVWQYYKLIGVQGHPQNNANTTDYFLSNIATETNQTLRDFSGSLDNTNGTFNPTAINIYQGKKKIVQGGCKGCHGNAQDADFSFVTKDAPFGGIPDLINLPLLKRDQKK